MVFGVFALAALTIAVVGVAGFLAFSVSARTREFGIRLAIGSQPQHLLVRVTAEGTVITALGIGAGLACGVALQKLAGSYFEGVHMPGAYWGGGHFADGSRGRVCVASNASRTRGCDSSPTRGLVELRGSGSSQLFLSVKRLFFGLEPVIGFAAGLIAVFDIEFVSAAADAFFERKFLDQGFLCAAGCGHGFTSTMTVSQAASGWKTVRMIRLRQRQSGSWGRKSKA
jgi:ABC-type antimicrobial peptide transport system permease subunit